MNEFFKKFFANIKGLWAKWTTVQKLVMGGIVLVALVGLIVVIAVSSAPTSVPLINVPIKDVAALQAIEMKLEQEGIRYAVGADGRVMVGDSATAMRAKAVLVREDLIPKGTDPWALFDTDRWTLTDFERDVNLRRAITAQLTQHIEAVEGVDNADVNIVIPADKLFAEDQNPVTASIIITPRPGSDLATNRAKIEGIQKLAKFAVEGLKDENIAITDNNGVLLNDWTNLAAIEKIDLTKREFKLRQEQEAKLRAKAIAALQKTYTEDRVRDLSVTLDIDMSAKTSKSTEYIPTVIKPRTPGSPYDDSDIRDKVTVSESTDSKTWQGTGVNPEGPAGVEGQTPTAYKDTTSMYGKVTTESAIRNYGVGTKVTEETTSPQAGRRTVSVNIDGTWKTVYDPKTGAMVIENGVVKREYVALPDAELKRVADLLKDAVGYDKARGDSVTVTNIAFDRAAEFKAVDAEFLRQQQLSQTIVYILIGVAILLVAFIVSRLISREIERRKRLREEELSRQHQIMRERALQQAEEEGIEVSMSVEERKRLEMQENAINMAKDHPEDVAQLIRTWLMEE